MPRHHDMGGLPAGPIDLHEHELGDWEREVDAIRTLLGSPERALLRADELRRAIEDMPTAEYLRLGYYERWCHAIVQIMAEKGIISAAEFERRVAERLAARETSG